MYPVTIVTTRYRGTYEGGEWAAFNLDPQDIPAGWDGSDEHAAAWWAHPPVPVGVGASAEAAWIDLASKVT
jgi:hypothetical protein